ncbi:MFS transporter [Niveispirillum sp. KHB5.9]|uniref:MFS transporter n=1 Tax=Niveispirillum sp. KHB5.9 TaxID=3400269 RepID=UPI003A8A0861
MGYLTEFRANWRALAAAGIGMAAGYLLVNYISNVFTPHLIQEFGWSRADLAWVGATAILGIIGQPIAGRLTDAFGVRRVALVGVITGPLIFLGLSMLSGNLLHYFLLCLAQVTIVGGTTSTVVYSRLIAQNFSRARGVALAIAACATPAVAALAIPFLSTFIDTNGWRAGYQLLAACAAVGGVVALALIPPAVKVAKPAAGLRSDTIARYRFILASPAFRLIFTGVVLGNLSWTLQTAQLKVLLQDHGIDGATSALALSLYAAGVIVGRLLCGVLLDRFPTYVVTAIAMGLPGIGLGLLATGTSSPVIVAGAVLLLGLSLGAEGDVLAYTVMRYFKIEIYSTVLGLVLAGLALSVTLGSLLLGTMLDITGNSFTAFLTLTSAAALLGGFMFLLLKRQPVVA